MYKKLFTLLLLLGFVWTVESQAQINQETNIVLKNGVKIKGAILDSFDGQLLKFRLSTGSEPISINYERIKKIEFRGNTPLSDEIIEKIDPPPGLRNQTFYHEFRGGLLFGDENTSGTVHTINGYQFSQYLGTGVGIGLNKFGNYISLPIYASAKGYLLDRKVAPFYFGDIGYGFAWKSNNSDDAFLVENVKGGLYWQVGLGYQVNYYKSSLVFALGYVNQQSKADYSYQYWGDDGVDVSEKRLLRRLNISVGFLF